MKIKKNSLFAVTLFCIGLTGLQAQTVKDIDGNVYSTVIIGTQVWMSENLYTTKYNDSTDIPLITDYNSWIDLSTPGYCWYKNDAPTFKNRYGALYNWYTVGTKKLCPTGWHVPTDAEWTELTDYLGGKRVAGGKLKETGTAHWKSPNKGATNETGFTALPGGSRGKIGSLGSTDIYGALFYGIHLYGYWWCGPGEDTSKAWSRCMYCNGKKVFRIYRIKKFGSSVRCLKD